MENNNDIELLQSKVRTLTETLEREKATSAKLQTHLINQAIRKNQTFQARVLDLDGMAEKLASRFTVEFVGDIPRVLAKERLVTMTHGFTNDVGPVVTELLQTEYKSHLLPEQPVNKPPEAKGDKQAGLEKLKSEYSAAKDRGDSRAMVAIKRRLAQAGQANLIL